MSGAYEGTIIEESLEDRAVLADLDILSTRVSPVTEGSGTPWIDQWTLHKVSIPEASAREAAERLSRALDREHAQAWYADFKNDTHHYVIFRDKVFFLDRTRKEDYDEAIRYGIELGIPEKQMTPIGRYLKLPL